MHYLLYLGALMKCVEIQNFIVDFTTNQLWHSGYGSKYCGGGQVVKPHLPVFT